MPIIDLGKVSGTDFTPDKSLNLSEENVLSVTTPVKQVISQEDFDALPDDEKNNGLYVIPGDGSSTSSGEVYSTDEIRIGTWIDGRPLYRKVVIGMSPSVTGATTLAIPMSSITDDSIDIVNFYGILHTQNGRKSPIDAYYGTTNYIASVLSNEGFHMYVASYYINCKITVTFEYTKTTDSPKTKEAST